MRCVCRFPWLRSPAFRRRATVITLVGGPAEIRQRFAAIVVGATTPRGARNTRQRLPAIVVRTGPLRRAGDAGHRFGAVIVETFAARHAVRASQFAAQGLDARISGPRNFAEQKKRYRRENGNCSSHGWIFLEWLVEWHLIVHYRAKNVLSRRTTITYRFPGTRASRPPAKRRARRPRSDRQSGNLLSYGA